MREQLLQAVRPLLPPGAQEALTTGYQDGLEQGFELSSGMSYEDLALQDAYDLGTYLGAWVNHTTRSTQ